MWNVCHKSGRVLFTTNNERTAMNRIERGWRVEKVDQSREQFEAWADKNFDGFGNKANNGDYYFEPVQIAWEAWQASRKELVIELPEPTDSKYCGPAPCMDGFDPDLYMSDLKTVLTRAGLTVKLS